MQSYVNILHLNTKGWLITSLFFIPKNNIKNLYNQHKYYTNIPKPNLTFALINPHSISTLKNTL